MKVRAINPSDINELKIIHDKFFKNEFEFPDFLNEYLSPFVVIDEEDKIITAGGVRTIAETVLITNKDYLIKHRQSALLRSLRMSSYIAGVNGFNQLHAFIQDKNWLRHLKRVGFTETKGQALVLNL